MDRAEAIVALLAELTADRHHLAEQLAVAVAERDTARARVAELEGQPDT